MTVHLEDFLPLPPMTPDERAVYDRLYDRSMRIGLSYQSSRGVLRPYHPSFPYVFEVSAPWDLNVVGDLRFYCLKCNTEWIAPGLLLHYLGADNFVNAIEREFAPHAHLPEPIDESGLDPSGVPVI